MKTDCRKCKYLYVTWDKNFPYGCYAMGFKGKNMPSITVKKQSGTRCLMFVKKASPKIIA